MLRVQRLSVTPPTSQKAVTTSSPAAVAAAQLFVTRLRFTPTHRFTPPRWRGLRKTPSPAGSSTSRRGLTIPSSRSPPVGLVSVRTTPPFYISSSRFSASKGSYTSPVPISSSSMRTTGRFTPTTPRYTSRTTTQTFTRPQTTQRFTSRTTTRMFTRPSTSTKTSTLRFTQRFTPPVTSQEHMISQELMTSQGSITSHEPTVESRSDDVVSNSMHFSATPEAEEPRSWKTLEMTSDAGDIKTITATTGTLEQSSAGELLNQSSAAWISADQDQTNTEGAEFKVSSVTVLDSKTTTTAAAGEVLSRTVDLSTSYMYHTTKNKDKDFTDMYSSSAGLHRTGLSVALTEEFTRSIPVTETQSRESNQSTDEATTVPPQLTGRNTEFIGVSNSDNYTSYATESTNIGSQSNLSLHNVTSSMLGQTFDGISTIWNQPRTIQRVSGISTSEHKLTTEEITRRAVGTRDIGSRTGISEVLTSTTIHQTTETSQHLQTATSDWWKMSSFSINDRQTSGGLNLVTSEPSTQTSTVATEYTLLWLYGLIFSLTFLSLLFLAGLLTAIWICLRRSPSKSKQPHSKIPQDSGGLGFQHQAGLIEEPQPLNPRVDRERLVTGSNPHYKTVIHIPDSISYYLDGNESSQLKLSSKSDDLAALGLRSNARTNQYAPIPPYLFAGYPGNLFFAGTPGYIINDNYPFNPLYRSESRTPLKGHDLATNQRDKKRLYPRLSQLSVGRHEENLSNYSSLMNATEALASPLVLDQPDGQSAAWRRLIGKAFNVSPRKVLSVQNNGVNTNENNNSSASMGLKYSTNRSEGFKPAAGRAESRKRTQKFGVIMEEEADRRDKKKDGKKLGEELPLLAWGNDLGEAQSETKVQENTKFSPVVQDTSVIIDNKRSDTFTD